MHIGPASPIFGPKECNELGMHTHLLFAAFQVTSLSAFSFVGNAVGATVQITRLYNSGVERLKNEEDWARMRLAFTCDLWKSVMRKEYFTSTAHWGAGQSRRGARVEMASGGHLRGAGGDNIHRR